MCNKMATHRIFLKIMTPSQRVKDETRNSIVSVETYPRQINWCRAFESRSTGVSTGTGFFVNIEGLDKLTQCPSEFFSKQMKTMRPQENFDCHLFLTCAHCVRNCDVADIKVSLPDHGAEKFMAVVLMFSYDIDVALLMCYLPKNRTLKVHPLSLGSSDSLEMGTKVYSMGFPLGGQIKMTEGVFSGFEGSLGIQHTSPISPGNSGGPLLIVDANNDVKVVGVNYQGVAAVGVSNVHYAQTIETFRACLYPALKADSILFRLPRIGMCFHNTTQDMREQYVGPEQASKELGVIVYHIELETRQLMWDLNGCGGGKVPRRDEPLPAGKGLTANARAVRKGLHKREGFLLCGVSWKDGAPNALYEFKMDTVLPKKKAPIGSAETKPAPVPAGSVPEEAVVRPKTSKQPQAALWAEVDSHGDVRVTWKKQGKISLLELLRRIPIDSEITLHGSFVDNSATSAKTYACDTKLVCSKNYVSRGLSKTLYYPYENTKKMSHIWLCLMGLCLMEGTADHTNYFKRLRVRSNKDFNKRDVIITHIFPSTKAFDSEVFYLSDRIASVNGVRLKPLIDSLDPSVDILKVFLVVVLHVLHRGGGKTQHLTLVNQEGKQFSMSLQNILKIESQHSDQGYHQPQHEFMTALRLAAERKPVDPVRYARDTWANSEHMLKESTTRTIVQKILENGKPKKTRGIHHQAAQALATMVDDYMQTSESFDRLQNLYTRVCSELGQPEQQFTNKTACAAAILDLKDAFGDFAAKNFDMFVARFFRAS